MIHPLTSDAAYHPFLRNPQERYPKKQMLSSSSGQSGKVPFAPTIRAHLLFGKKDIYYR